MPSDPLALSAASSLEQLLESLAKAVDRRVAAGTVPADAIDRELQRAARTTTVQSVRRHPAMEAWRQESRDAAVRLDALRQLLGLAQALIGMLMSR